MTTSQKNDSSKIFIDWIPAELKYTSGENWMIVYFVRKPGTDKMKRFRNRVKKISNKSERKRLAKRMCADINEKLKSGWTPFYEGKTTNKYRLFTEALELYMSQAERKSNDGLIRKDSFRAYNSFSNNINQYLKEKELTKIFAIQFDKEFVLNFLDFIYYERKRTARTHNNYLSFLNQVAIFMTDRKYIPINPVTGISKKKVSKKKREIIPIEIRDRIFKYQTLKNTNYLCLCLTVYFCFIRRTEISKLKVKHVSLQNDSIFIPGEISKNKKDGVVTIPKMLKEIFIDHLENSTQEDYLFSSEKFKPGKNKLNPKKISDEWSKMRKELNFNKAYQFYSLKDSGITQLFNLNVPLIKIRDQARHHDIKITETYAPRSQKADEFLRDLDFNF